MGIVIRNGEVVTASSASWPTCASTAARSRRSARSSSREAGDETIDAAGQFVFPGFVDPHVHMELRFMGTVSADDFETGTASARPAARRASSTSASRPPASRCWRRSTHGAGRRRRRSPTTRSTWRSPRWGDDSADEMRAVVQEHGITSFKVFMAYKGAIMVDDAELYSVMKRGREAGRGRHRARRERRRGLAPAAGAGREGRHRPRVPPGLAPAARSRARPPTAR